MIALAGKTALWFAFLFAFLQGVLPILGSLVVARKLKFRRCEEIKVSSLRGTCAACDEAIQTTSTWIASSHAAHVPRNDETLISSQRQNVIYAYLSAVARPAALGQFICIIIAYLLLTIAFVTNDFSIIYVATNSHPALPLMYRLAGVWGGHEGSILLWIVMLNIWTMAFLYTVRPEERTQCASRRVDDSTRSLTLAIFGLINFCFLAFLIFTSNPFLTAAQPLIPQDLNPLLQDPGLVIHPPMLYAGYVGFSAAFAITLAALLQNQLNTAWAKRTRLFAIAAWCFLTLGITLGSWWAYRVLGWGGFWFWDPVENASLLPWLSGTALIHTLILAEKRQIAVRWAVFLAIVTFALSLLGTFLVRSGILISSHTFANDPARGVFLLILLGLLLFISLIIFLWRLPHITSSPVSFSFLSRETGLLMNSGLLFTAMLTVLLGTLYPLIFDALHLGAISVGPPYFNQVMFPLALITLIIMMIGPLCAWQKQSAKLIWQQSAKKIAISFVVAFILIFSITQHFNLAAILIMTLSFCVITNVISFLKLQPGMTLAHTGFAILLIGILLSSTLNQERNVRIHPGSSVTLGPYQFIFLDTQSVIGPNYRGIRAAFDVIKNTHHVINLYPEKRIYTVREMIMTKVDIHPGIFRDLYIALGQPLNETDWSVRIYYKPFVRWIWFGGLLMMLGGILSITRGKT